MMDFFGVELAVGDIVVTPFATSWGKDIYEYCTVVRFTEKAAVIDRLNFKEDSKARTKRVPVQHLIKVDPAHYTMYILKKSKETV